MPSDDPILRRRAVSRRVAKTAAAHHRQIDPSTDRPTPSMSMVLVASPKEVLVMTTVMDGFHPW